IHALTELPVFELGQAALALWRQRNVFAVGLIQRDLLWIVGVQKKTGRLAQMPAPGFIYPNQDRLVFVPVERFKHVFRRQQRYFMFRRFTAEEQADTNFWAHASSSRLSACRRESSGMR